MISSKIQGRLSELKVEEGSYVKKNEVIARLEDTDYKAAVAKAFPEHAARIRQLLGALTQAEQRELSRLCKKLGTGVNSER